MKYYNRIFIQIDSQNTSKLYAYLHDTTDVDDPKKGYKYQVNPDDVYMLISSDLYRKEDGEYPIIDYTHMLDCLKLDVYYRYETNHINMYDGMLGSSMIPNIQPIHMVHYCGKNGNNEVVVKSVLDYVELHLTTNENKLNDFKKFLNGFDIYRKVEK